MRYQTSELFHKKYSNMCDHIVIVTLKNGETIEGIFSDEFYEDMSILISPIGSEVVIVKISDIVKMVISDKD